MAAKVIAPLSALVLIIFLAKAAAASPQTDWLKAQQDLFTTGLVDSYEADGQRYAYTYDQALAIIAFTEAGELQRTRKLLDRMKSLQDASGRWLQCYDASNGALGHSGCNYYPAGDIAWMVVAINYYEAKTADTQYADMAVKALGWLGSLMDTNLASEKYGSIRLCDGTSCQYPNAVSTENNHDAYSAYFWRSRLSGNSSYKDKALLIRDYLIREMWAPSPSSNGPYHNVNVFWRGFNDFAWCTDGQTWGVLSLGLVGPNGEEFYKSLEWLYYNPYGSTRNQKDYNSSVASVDGFEGCTEDVDHVWLEGTEGAAAAYYAAGERNKGEYFHGQTGRVVSANGGVIYTFTDSDPSNIRWKENWRYNSLASTAWYYFNDRGINPLNLSFTTRGDVNGDCAVNIFDLAKVGLCYGCAQGQPCWQSCGIADTSPNSKIDIFDLATVGLNYGKNC